MIYTCIMASLCDKSALTKQQTINYTKNIGKPDNLTFLADSTRQLFVRLPNCWCDGRIGHHLCWSEGWGPLAEWSLGAPRCCPLKFGGVWWMGGGTAARDGVFFHRCQLLVLGRLQISILKHYHTDCRMIWAWFLPKNTINGKKSCSNWIDKTTKILKGVFTISTGAGFCPSKVNSTPQCVNNQIKQPVHSISCGIVSTTYNIDTTISSVFLPLSLPTYLYLVCCVFFLLFSFVNKKVSILQDVLEHLYCQLSSKYWVELPSSPWFPPLHWKKQPPRHHTKYPAKSCAKKCQQKGQWMQGKLS